MSDSDSDSYFVPKRKLNKHSNLKKKKNELFYSDSDISDNEKEYGKTSNRYSSSKTIAKKVPNDIPSDDEFHEFMDKKYNKPQNSNPHQSSPISNQNIDKPLPSSFSLPSAEEQPKVWVLVGQCASGKTHCLKYIHYLYAHQKHFKFGITFTPTSFTGDYSWAPKRSIRDFDEEYFKQYIMSLRQKTEAGVEKHGKGWKLPRNYVIFDDNNGILSQSPFMINFISTHRHTNTTVFILSQLLTARGAVSTTMRANTSIALMWPTSNHQCLKGLYENFGGAMTREQFEKALDNCRKRKYSCLVLKNSPENRTVHEQFCEIVAGNVPDFQIVF
jgi:hypothetical protein